MDVIMKNYYKNKIRSLLLLCLFVCSGLTFWSCEDFLERDNPIATTDERWWLNRSQLNNALNSVYLGINSGVITYDKPKYSSASNYSWAAINMTGLTDDAIFASNYQDWSPFLRGEATSAHQYMHEYYMKFTLIRYACRFLENYHRASLPVVSNPEDGIQIKDRMAAEARALRAYLHMELFMLFGPVPIVRESLDSSEQFVARASQEELVKFIVDELEEASNNLPREYSVEADKWRISRGACYAMQAQLYLFTGKYAEAAAAAKRVIDLKVYELYKHPTDPDKSYQHLFTYDGQNNKERVLWTLKANRQILRRLAPNGLSAGQSGLSPTASLVNAYETLDGYTLDELPAAERAEYIKNPNYNNNRDPRLKMTIWCPNEDFEGYVPDPWSDGKDKLGATSSTQTGYWMKKWLTRRDEATAAESGSLDFANIRYAEVLLIYVEGLIESGEWKHADVTRYLNMIRNRAGMPDVDETRYNSQEKLRELVRRERRVELAFEGQRLLDIRRWRIGEQVLNGPVYGAVRPGSDAPLLVENRVFSDRDYYWPIPIAEINANANMTQNPGW